MVNHVRTLLLNLRPATTPGFGEEFVPDDYQPVVLTPLLTSARDALFGPTPSRAAMNLNLARLLAYLHTSPWRDDVLVADARITYDPSQPSADADPSATTYNVLSAATGFPDADEIFDPERSESELNWYTAWGDAAQPAALRVGALALALAARTEDLRGE